MLLLRLTVVSFFGCLFAGCQEIKDISGLGDEPQYARLEMIVTWPRLREEGFAGSHYKWIYRTWDVIAEEDVADTLASGRIPDDADVFTIRTLGLVDCLHASLGGLVLQGNYEGQSPCWAGYPKDGFRCTSDTQSWTVRPEDEWGEGCTLPSG